MSVSSAYLLPESTCEQAKPIREVQTNFTLDSPLGKGDSPSLPLGKPEL
jgi:hypothetical protein